MHSKMHPIPKYWRAIPIPNTPPIMLALSPKFFQLSSSQQGQSDSLIPSCSYSHHNLTTFFMFINQVVCGHLPMQLAEDVGLS